MLRPFKCISKSIKRFRFNRKWKEVAALEMDYMPGKQPQKSNLSIIHPLTGEKLDVLGILLRIDTWYILQDGYTCICNSNTGYPMYGEPFEVRDNVFWNIHNTWVAEYLEDRRKLLDE